MDKAQKYTDKAIAQIEKLRNSYDSKPLLLSSFQGLYGKPESMWKPIHTHLNARCNTFQIQFFFNWPF